MIALHCQAAITAADCAALTDKRKNHRNSEKKMLPTQLETRRQEPNEPPYVVSTCYSNQQKIRHTVQSRTKHIESDVADTSSGVANV